MFIKGKFLHKVRTKLHSMITHMLMSWFETFDSKQKNTKSTERWKTSFSKETVENADLHKAILNKTMTTYE